LAHYLQKVTLGHFVDTGARDDVPTGFDLEERPLNVRRLHALLVVAATMAFAQGAQATLLSGLITGTVTSTGGAVPGLTLGSAVSGSYTYDSTLTMNDAVGAVHPLTAFSLSIGTNPQHFFLTDLFVGAPFLPGVLTTSTGSTDRLFFDILGFPLNNFVGEAGALGSFNFNTPQIFAFNTPDAAHSFAFTLLASRATTAAAIPEPETTALLGLGCLAAVVGRACRTRSRRRKTPA
jgi:PEP-CTERM motif